MAIEVGDAVRIVDQTSDSRGHHTLAKPCKASPEELGVLLKADSLSALGVLGWETARPARHSAIRLGVGGVAPPTDRSPCVRQPCPRTPSHSMQILLVQRPPARPRAIYRLPPDTRPPDRPTGQPCACRLPHVPPPLRNPPLRTCKSMTRGVLSMAHCVVKQWSSPQKAIALSTEASLCMATWH